MSYTAHNVVDWTGYLFHGEVDALQEWARSLPPSPVVVNIGAGNGTSGLAFLQARDDLSLTTIDVQLESSPFGCLEGEWAVFNLAGLWPLPPERYAWIHGDSKEAGKKWKGGPVDLVFVDGDHSYEGCAGDIRAWLPNVKPGGLLVVHDYHKEERYAQPVEGTAPHPKPWHGVDQAVDELLIDRFEVFGRMDTAIAFRVGGDEEPLPEPKEKRSTKASAKRTPRKKAQEG
jgi:predicted O-methyltransferase YrrM